MRSYITAMQAGDWDAGMAHFADDVVIHVPGRSRLAGTRRGRAEVEAYLRGALGDGTVHASVELIDMLVGEDHVGLVVHEVLRHGDRVLDMRRSNVYRVRDGAITEISIFEADQHGVDEFFG